MALADFNAISLIAFLVGLFLGNRLAIDRDKRREWNDLIEPVRAILFEERQTLSPVCEKPTVVAIERIREKFFLWKRRRFDMAVQQYQESTAENNMAQLSWGVLAYRNEQAVLHAINDLLFFLRPK